MPEKLPVLPSTVGKIAHLTFPDGSTMQWKVVEEIRRNEYENKILILQRMHSGTDGNQEMLRFAYYIIGKTGNKKGRWTWGQYAPFISREDFTAMIDEARNKGWIR